jgi:hypothetical protein
MGRWLVYLSYVLDRLLVLLNLCLEDLVGVLVAALRKAGSDVVPPDRLPELLLQQPALPPHLLHLAHDRAHARQAHQHALVQIYFKGTESKEAHVDMHG